MISRQLRWFLLPSIAALLALTGLVALPATAAPRTSSSTTATGCSGTGYPLQITAPVLGTLTPAQANQPSTCGDNPSQSGLLQLQDFPAATSCPPASTTGPCVQNLEVLNASCVSSATAADNVGTSYCESSALAATVFIGGHTISADLLRSESTSQCGAASSSSSEVAGLTIDGNHIAVGNTPASVTVPGTDITVYIARPAPAPSSQTTTSGGTTTTHTTSGVTALEIAAPAEGIDVQLAHAESDITCQQTTTKPGKCSSPRDWVTGGGWIITSSGSRANFGGSYGIKKGGAPSGHLNYIDHGTTPPTHLKGSTVTAYTAPAPNQRHAEGTGTVGQGSTDTPAQWQSDVTDGGTPGRNGDYLHVRWTSASGSYDSGNQPLQGGNIKIHTLCALS